MSTSIIQPKSEGSAKEAKFDWCPICQGTSFEAQTFNTAGNLVESQEMDGACFVCNGAKVISIDSICVCGRAASWKMLEGKLKGTMYCGRLECLKRVQQGESARRIIVGWGDEDKDDDIGKDADYSRQFPYGCC